MSVYPCAKRTALLSVFRLRILRVSIREKVTFGSVILVFISSFNMTVVDVFVKLLGLVRGLIKSSWPDVLLVVRKPNEWSYSLLYINVLARLCSDLFNPSK
jgi:hypothetical protein